MTEHLSPNTRPNLPSGFISSEQLPMPAVIGPDVLPWLKEPQQLNIAQCEVEGGQSFLLASAVGTHDRLRVAANGMTSAQREIADNMFYSRIQPFIANKHSRLIETMPQSTTEFPIHVMRNNGGQRVYFGIANLPLGEKGEAQPVVLRLGVCDKNKQAEVMKVLSRATPNEQRSKKK